MAARHLFLIMPYFIYQAHIKVKVHMLQLLTLIIYQ